MDKWKRIALVLGGVLVLMLVALLGLGVWFVRSNLGADALAAVTGQNPTPAIPMEGTPAAKNGKAGNKPEVKKAEKIAATFGTVMEVKESSLTLTTSGGGSRTLVVGPKTRLVVVGTLRADPKLSDIQPGDKVLVVGLNHNNQSLEPRAIIAAPSSYGKNNIALGRVDSVASDTMTLLNQGARTNVVLASDTQVFGKGLRALSSSDLQPNDYAIVIGSTSSDQTLRAQVILSLEDKRDRAPAAQTHKPTPTRAP